MKAIELTYATLYDGGPYYVSREMKNLGEHIRVYRAEDVERLVVAAREMINSRSHNWEIAGYHPKTGRPLNRHGMASVTLDMILSELETSINREKDNEGDNA